MLRKMLILIVQIIILISSASVSAVAGGESKVVPQNLPACISELKRTLPPETIGRLTKEPESVVNELHLSVGMWIRNEWIRGSGGSPLLDYFRKMGVSNPDDISSIILRSLWRDLHRQPLRLEEQVKSAREYWYYQSPQVTEKRALSNKMWNTELPLSNGKRIKLLEWKGKPFILALVYRDYVSIKAVRALNEINSRYASSGLHALCLVNLKLTQNAAVTPQLKSTTLASLAPGFPAVVDLPDAFVSELRTALIAPGGMSLPEIILVGKDGNTITRFQTWESQFDPILSREIDKAVKAK